MSLSKVTLDTPPSAPRPVAYHPYHPEPWTPESPILLLLSRFSHATDPSAALVSTGVMSALVYYLTQHQDPSSRCFRMLIRLSCNPNCLQALVRSGSVALIQYHLCQREEGGAERQERQTGRVKAKVKQLGLALLNNLRVQCESGFGSGVLSHVMLSGTESDKMNCALSLPLICSNKALLKKLLVDSGGLLLALQPLRADDDHADMDEDHSTQCERLLCDAPPPGLTSHLHSLYFSLAVQCLSALINGVKTLDRKPPSPVRARPLGTGGRLSPPPLKKPRLSDTCLYSVSNFDLFLLLDDGARVPANREAVSGAEGADGAGSEYFRALLRGGFGEAQGTADAAIPIKDVSVGMLLPVLHYLHGCRLAKPTREMEEDENQMRCQVLDALVLEGLDFHPKQMDDGSFLDSPLGQTMVGACRFLVTDLQKDLEDLCALLLRRFVKAAEDFDAGKLAHKTDHVCSESAEENLVNRTSELELSGLELQKPNSSAHQRTLQKAKTIKAGASGSKPGRVDKALSPDETGSKPKSFTKASAQVPKPEPQDSVPSSGRGGAGAALLPQVYWFSQRYSYPALGRACLSLLLGCQDPPGPSLNPAHAGVCLRRLARAADCTETLKQDLVRLASAALS